MRILGVLSGLWIVANLLLFSGPHLFARWTGWYTYANPGWGWYVWLLAPPVVALGLGLGLRLQRRRRRGAAA